MELKTIILDNIEYVLVPRDLFEKNIKERVKINESHEFQKIRFAGGAWCVFF